MKTIWDYSFLNNSVADWLLTCGIFVAALLLLKIVQSIIVKRLIAFSSKTKTTIDDLLIGILRSSVMPLLYVVALYLSLQYLELPARWRSVEHVAIMIVFTFFVIKMINTCISYLFSNSYLQREPNEQRKKQSRGILLIAQVVVWVGGLLFLVDNLGYDITTLVAGLGIGGIAIALAAQTILGDLFSYLVIFFDRPFEIGDFIILDDKMGTVEYIGIKTTRIRTLGGEQLVCSNTDLTNSRVHNFKRMQERRVVFTFGVVYDTTAAKLQLVPGMVKSIIESLPDTRFDRAHFKGFGNSSLDFEVVYYMKTPDYNQYMDRQQSINLKIFETFEQEHIEFAFPTQTIFVRQNNRDQHEDNEPQHENNERKRKPSMN